MCVYCTDVVRYLLSVCRDQVVINLSTVNGRSCLHIAALTDSVELLCYLLDLNAHCNLTVLFQVRFTYPPNLHPRAKLVYCLCYRLTLWSIGHYSPSHPQFLRFALFYARIRLCYSVQSHLSVFVCSVRALTFESLDLETSFTARRYASAVLAVIVCPSVRLSVRLSVRHKSELYKDG